MIPEVRPEDCQRGGMVKFFMGVQLATSDEVENSGSSASQIRRFHISAFHISYVWDLSENLG